MGERCFVLPNFYPLTCGLHNVVLLEYRVASADSMEEIDQAENYATCYVCPVSDSLIHTIMDV